jgi:hypothetical protein
MSNMLDILKKLDAVENKTKLTECGPMPSSAPSTPVSVNLSAPTAHDMAQMLRALANIESGEAKPAMAAMPMAMAADAMEAEYETDEEFVNEPDEQYADHKFMTKDLSGGINREKNMYPPAAKGDNPMAVEGADISPKYIKHLQLALRNWGPQLSRSETRELQDILDKLSIANIKTIMNADIPHLSQMAKLYLRNKTPGGMNKYGDGVAESIKDRLYRALNEKKAAKDFDGDGKIEKSSDEWKGSRDKAIKKSMDKKEPMKKAVADKKKNPFGNKK